MSQNPIFDSIEHDVMAGAHAVRGWFDRTPETPAAQAAAAPIPTEDRMSLLTDAEALYAGAKNELAKFEQALPGALEKAKQFEASPFAQLAEKAAGTVLPPEAVAIAVGAAEKVLDDLIGLYTPAQPQQPPAGQ